MLFKMKRMVHHGLIVHNQINNLH